tara:strand:- start:485 stop:742 length:258 start_codon:yes stop_codon:yes gene_type:complete
MSDIRERLSDILRVHYTDNVEDCIATLIDEFHISEKLTEEERELIRLCKKHRHSLGASRQDMNELLNVIDKLTGESNERSTNTTN